MARPEKPVHATGGAAAAFANELRQLRALAGNPTYRDMARSALFSSSVLSSAASGTRLPTLQVALGFVEACGGDREDWRRRWLRAANVTTSDAPTRGRYRSSSADQAMPRPAQLPLRPTGFIGRTAELDRLRTPAATPVVITGPVGVGKSDFALHHAHRVATDMVDGQLYADLRPLTGTASDAGYVLDGFLRALGVPPDQMPGTLDQRAGLYRSLLAERELLVLLDNVRDERQVRPLLAESRTSVTLVVSRTPLLGLGGVRRIRLDVPPRADSIRMIQSALPERARDEPRECDRLAELCGDLPVALDIALRKLVARPGLSLSRATAKLLERDGALNWLRIGDLSLRDSFDSAFRDVSAAARTLLMRVARLAFRCDPESVLQGGAELAEELVDAGLLRRGDRSAPYRIEGLVRAFAIEASVAPQEDHIAVPTQTEWPRPEPDGSAWSTPYKRGWSPNRLTTTPFPTQAGAFPTRPSDDPWHHNAFPLRTPAALTDDRVTFPV